MIDSGPTRPETAGHPPPGVSVLLPVFDEEEALPRLLDRLFAALKRLDLNFEVLAVNDGSRDGSLDVLRDEATIRPELRVIDFRRNFGQTAALMAGIDHAKGDILVSLDADLQNDPDDIPELLAKLNEGFGVVSGWRRGRQDGLVRSLASRVANRLISYISGVSLHDHGCTLKAYRRDVISGVKLYGEMHRFIPIYATWMGARVAEIPVHHHPRVFGRSKYGFERIPKVVLDLIVVKFLESYLAKPIYLFGGFGVASLLLSLVGFLLMLYWKIFKGIAMILTPVPTVVAITFLVGCMSILMGLLAEILVRTYFESQGQASYKIRELINFDRRD